jgi:transcriptional regulator with XRE-family HTH domain
MSHWTKLGGLDQKIDVEILEESALAQAQSTIQNAITQSGVSRAELARRMIRNRSYVSQILGGGHNLTVKTMARALAACGCEVRFHHVPISWHWREEESAIPVRDETELPACAGSTMPIEKSMGIVLPVEA